MTIIKSDEIVKGVLIFEGRVEGRVEGKLEYELTVPSEHSFSSVVLADLPAQKREQTREGQFIILDDTGAIAFLNYMMRYSGNDPLKSEAAIRLNGPEFDIHHFENGEYQYSRIPSSSSFFDKVQFPPGIKLCRYSPDQRGSEAMKLAENLTPENSEKLREMNIQQNKEIKRANSLNVIVENFEIPPKVRKELKDAQDQYLLIKTLIGKYL